MPGAELRADVWISEYITPWDIYQHGVTRILAARRTRWQEMHIVETGAYGKALVLDGKWQSCTGDEFIYHESLVHPAMLRAGQPRRVLILGGGEGATLREVLRWSSVERATMVDIDGEVVEACREHLAEMHQGAFDDPRAELVIGDALEVIDDSPDGHYDVVISDLSDPIEEGPSFKLFTREYFARLRRVLAPQGVAVVQAGPVSPPELALHARLVSTLRAVFAHTASYCAHVPSYAAPWGFALAADRPLDLPGDPAALDALLAERTTGGLRYLDGRTLVALDNPPLYVREAVARETRVYTLDEPPRFFGTGQGPDDAR
ncbi:MAG: methyltransferase domain-containing protein [Acidobacteria bacterium]|nr:MAG: methyltransferase domain-containing protein [Acidobacteriota bacterium]